MEAPKRENSYDMAQYSAADLIALLDSAAGKSPGNSAAMVRSASTPPMDAPIAIAFAMQPSTVSL